MSQQTQERIVQTKLEKLIDEVQAKHGVELTITPEVIAYICRDLLQSDTDAGGARAAIAKMESEVVTAVARYINEHPQVASLHVQVGGEQSWKDKHLLESNAYIEVVERRNTGMMR